MTIQLFRIITVRDEFVVGFSLEDLAVIGCSSPAGIGRRLADEGALGVWQYAVRHASDGSLEQGPLRQVSILANHTVRIEPYVSPWPVVGHTPTT